MMNEKKVKTIVKDNYRKIAQQKTCGCCSSSPHDVNIAKSIGYTDEELAMAGEANLGLGCGNPTALAQIREGDVVLDLGSGAGFDAFLAVKKVGATGKVIGVDFTEEMVEKARGLADKYHHKNVEFKVGDIETLPIDNESIDVILSNCVINLSPNKLKVFQEAYRVLKTTGRMYVSDIVLLSELTESQRNNEELLAGCVGGALLKEEYLALITTAGFRYRILNEDKDISKRQYQGIHLESLKVEVYK